VDGRTIETRIMVGSQVVKVSGWFPNLINEREAIRQLRERYCPSTDLSHVKKNASYGPPQAIG